MKNSPLQLDHHFLVSLHIDADAEGRDQPPSVSTRHRAAPDESNPLKWVVSVEVTLTAPEKSKAAYIGKIEFIGYFTVDPNFPKDKVERLVSVNGATMLYAAAREMILNVTARGPWRGVQLPSVSFVEDTPKATPPAPPAKTTG